MHVDSVVTAAVRAFVDTRSVVSVVEVLAAIAPGREVTRGDKLVAGRALRSLGFVPRLVRRGQSVQRLWLSPRFAEASAPLGRYLIDHPPVNE